MLNERRRSVLSALVEEYVASVQPVGSKVLVQRYGLGCSPATVRSELAALEETGHVFQPHVSAGRIPTDSGYRAYVDDVVGLSAAGLAPQDAARVRLHYDSVEREMGEVLHETSVLLSRLTSYVAVVVAPTFRRARIKRVTLVPLGLEPYLDLGMRLGEGTGAALGLSFMAAACAIMNGMATFSEAGVADRGGS